MTTERSELRAAIDGHLLPALRQLGFEGPRVIAGNALLHEFRRSAGRKTHVLTVQFEKHGLPRFILNLAIEPPEGFESVIEGGGKIRQGRVKPRPGPSTRSWFRSDTPLWRRIIGAPSSTAASAVAACVALLPEMEAWWQTGAASPHITVLETHFKGGQRAAA